MNLKSKKVVISAAIAGVLVITPAAMAIQSTIAAPGGAHGSHGNSGGGGARGGYGNNSKNTNNSNVGGQRRVADRDTPGDNSQNRNYESRNDSGYWTWVPGNR